MIDIDHFKSFNDTYGHDEGDNALKLVARVLADELENKVYRYGGEEFCAVFPGINGEDAFMYLNRVRRNLEERAFIIRQNSPKSSSAKNRKSKSKKGKKVQITISIGLASPEYKSQKPEEVIKLADQALYQAKENGRNCVVAWKKQDKKATAAV